MLVRTTGMVVWLAVACVLVGCHAPASRVTIDPVPTDSSSELMEYIGDQPFVTAEAGYRAAHMIWAGETFEGDFGELRGVLVANEIADRLWRHEANSSLTRGDVGYLICRACDIKTGVNWRLLGLGRYAYRELQYHKIAGQGGELGLVSGGEFQGIVRRADEYQRLIGKAPTGRAELGAEPGTNP